MLAIAIRIISIFLFLILCVKADAQEVRCLTDEKMAEQLAADPDFAERRKEIEKFSEQWISENSSTYREVITIPVVVHVVYRTQGENLPDVQIRSQINVLNEDYRMTNADAANVPSVWNNVKVDSEIEFCLANRDPNGNPTTGITRTQTTVTNWAGSDNVKRTDMGGKDPWPANQYLNIWVCNIGSGLLGFAYLPGISSDLDGVVIGHRFFGKGFSGLSNSYNLGRTTTHEVGHYLNLHHLWGQGASNPNCNADDFVTDTPRQEDPNYGCKIFPHVSCNNGPNGDMFNNYMDYGNDACLFFYTSGQKQRMLATMNGPRASLKNSLGCSLVSVEDVPLTERISIFPNPASDRVTVSGDLGTSGKATYSLTNLAGQQVLEGIMTNTSDRSISVEHLPAGMYLLKIATDSDHTVKRIFISQ
jgi:hypothetical protein